MGFSPNVPLPLQLSGVFRRTNLPAGCDFKALFCCLERAQSSLLPGTLCMALQDPVWWQKGVYVNNNMISQ